MIFLHELRLEEYLRHKSEESPSMGAVLTDYSQYATPTEFSFAGKSHKIPFKIFNLQTHLTKEDYNEFRASLPEGISRAEFKSRITEYVSKGDRIKFRFEKARILPKESLINAMISDSVLQIRTSNGILQGKVDSISETVGNKIKECINQRAIDAIRFIGTQGGHFILPDKYLETESEGIGNQKIV